MNSRELKSLIRTIDEMAAELGYANWRKAGDRMYLLPCDLKTDIMNAKSENELSRIMMNCRKGFYVNGMRTA